MLGYKVICVTGGFASFLGVGVKNTSRDLPSETLHRQLEIMKHNIVDKRDYIGYFKKKLKGGSDKEKAAHMREMQSKCLEYAKKNPNENWFRDKLISAKLPVKFTRQSIWGYRLYDFWCHELGCAIEIDGPEHKEPYDRYRDVYNYLRSGIVILRIQNKNEQDAIEALEFLSHLDTWKERRLILGIDSHQKVGKINIINPNSDYWSL